MTGNQHSHPSSTLERLAADQRAHSQNAAPGRIYTTECRAEKRCSEVGSQTAGVEEENYLGSFNHFSMCRNARLIRAEFEGGVKK